MEKGLNARRCGNWREIERKNADMQYRTSLSSIWRLKGDFMKLSLYFKLAWRLASVIVVILLLTSAAWAQETPPEVWVTTQHNANLRVGPGTNWDVITLLPAGTT